MKSLAEGVDVEAAAINDAFQRAYRYVFRSVNGNNDLTSVCMAPLLMTAGLADQTEPLTAQRAGYSLCG
jgi:hypothetical protein